MAMCRRSRSASIVGSLRRRIECVERASIAEVRLLPQEASDSDDRGGAYSRRLVNVAIGHVAAVEQAGDVPSLREGADLLRRAKIGEQLRHLRFVGGREERGAQIRHQLGAVAGGGEGG